MSKQKRSPIWRAIRAAGGPRRVARAFNLKSDSTPGHWVTRNRVPEFYVIDLCRMAKGVVQPHQIDPEVFGPEVRV